MSRPKRYQEGEIRARVDLVTRERVKAIQTRLAADGAASSVSLIVRQAIFLYYYLTFPDTERPSYLGAKKEENDRN